MSADRTPALSPSEWADATESKSYLTYMVEEAADDLAACFATEDDTPSRMVFAVNTRRHALAALALHGQPFGFTREDVTDLRAATASAYSWDVGKQFGDPADPVYARLESLADRIEALLPPEPQ